MRFFKSKPSEVTFLTRSSSVSSKAMNTPGSPNSTAPRTRNSAANKVLPQPGPPQTRVGRPLGRPPAVTSSKPEMPVRVLGSWGRRGARFFMTFSWFSAFLEIESDEHALEVGHVSDEQAQGRRQLLDQRRDGHDLLVAGELGLLVDVDDLERVSSGEVRLADVLDARDRARRRGRGPRHVQAQHVLRRLFRVRH